MIIDDREANEGEFVTECVTCYRIRPLAPIFGGKTLLIVDTPGYVNNGDTDYDNFFSAAMQVFFQNIGHVNSVIFTCKSDETRTWFLNGTATNVFSLFDENIHSCLYTLYTFSGAENPQARAALKALEWPVENGEVKVNNAALTVEVERQSKETIEELWNLSVNGQFLLMDMLLSKPPVPTKNSFEVTKDRIPLQEKCQLAHKTILDTAVKTQMLIIDLRPLFKALGAPPDQKLQVFKYSGTYEWLVPKELLKNWNDAANNVENVLLYAINTYIHLQEHLHYELLQLVELDNKLTATALRHNPKGLINYIDTWIKAVELAGAPPVQLAQLVAANTIILHQKIKHRGQRVGNVIVDVVKAVQKEMQRRMALEPQQCAQEEWKSSSLYNDFYNKLSGSIKQRAPPKLKSSARYTKNLDIFVVLIKVLVMDGDLQASISEDEGTD